MAKLCGKLVFIRGRVAIVTAANVSCLKRLVILFVSSSV